MENHFWAENKMEVVYFFCTAEAIRVPFFACNDRLFLLFASQGGKWDKMRHQFTFERSLNTEHLSKKFPAIIFVQVEENASVPIKIFGFKERPWEQSADICPIDHDSTMNNAVLAIAGAISKPLSLPEKFPEQWQLKLEEALRSRKYSPQTRRSYQYYNRLLCNTIQKSPDEIRQEDITHFLALVERDKEYSASSINLAISAIKFFYREMMKDNSIQERHRPRHDARLPQVLSQDEIGKILAMENNPKHRLLLMLAYSSGLRVSEVVALKREHIDFSRKVIYVRLGKGRKDRCTILSEKASRVIAEYCAGNNIETWLFPGQIAGRSLTIRSAQHIFNKAVRRAKIEKAVSIHSLRHTFATHLLESGTDIRYIQELLGHSNVRTTERYTRVARRSILSIKSPFDSIF